MDFHDPALLSLLETADEALLDEQTFGVIAMGRTGVVEFYNHAESTLSGLQPANVVGRHCFREIAPCTDNHMVARKYDGEGLLDEVLDYVFTLRMKLVKVQLRLLKGPTSRRQYLVVRPR
jgi:photoactive yellow protein